MDALDKKAWRAVARMTVILSTVLFLAAGTLRYWQAWVFLACFVGPTVWITRWLMRNDRDLLARRLAAGVRAEALRGQKLVIALAGLAFVAELLLPALQVRLGHAPIPAVAVVLGNALVVLAFAIVGRVYLVNSYTSATIQVEGRQQLASTGPYRLVRHPMYAAVGLCILGIPVALAYPSGYLAAVPLLALLVVRTLSEERHLYRELPGYAQYCQAVPHRLIPHIW